ncbi:MAG: transglycosylase domain-containing protein [Propionicimonas sp.]|uniref:transglycosylase domain-containing protein n=1 Tax=Propionicimonas sp. TaxID=1955623 RepID=UPI002B21F3C8|nr:transglycosylase domain-containing protein [Propionicimonas sp.]MEA4945797.1 transglycosylase domain-containing protein [Propionicimonas sp.]MEA5052246.1 transglycosylase domain-containing protein [Propionicimonas sp.]
MHLGKRLYSLLMFLGVSVLGGLLVAGLGVPATSMLTSGGKDMMNGLADLPTDLDVQPEAERSRLLNADGSLLATFYDQNRVVVGLDKIAPIMVKAQIAIEDHRFREHGAIDLTGTLRALASTASGVTQGGSTITQQYVRLRLVQDALDANDKQAYDKATENTVARKIREMRYAIGLEQKLSKDEIIERYLNISYYGDGAYGVEAAAKHFFGVSASKLNLAQAAMLAGSVRNPLLTNPVKNPALAIERRNNVIDRMLEIGDITPEEAAAAKAEDFDQSKVTDNKMGCKSAEFPFICQYAEYFLLESDQSPLGSTYDERKDRLYNDGLTIKTTIKPSNQRKVQKAISNYIDARDQVIGVVTMIEPSTGRIVTMAQSRPKMGDNKAADGKKDQWKGETYYNYAVTKAEGGAEGFQGGSTFKMFVAAAALDQGMGAYGKYQAKQHMDFTGKIYRSCKGNFAATKWPVTGGYGGAIDMFTGVKKSVNTYFAQLEQGAGVCESVTMATKLGLKMGMPTKTYPSIMAYDSTPSFTLGAIEVSPLSLVSAYATVANRGVHCDPILLDSIKTKQGAELPVPDANCRRVLDKDVADSLNYIFQGPMNGGTATPAKLWGVQMAGKTGTVSKNKAIWTMGYTPEIAAGAVISYDSGQRFADYYSHRKNTYIRGAWLKHSGHGLQGASGSEAGGHLLKPALSAVIKDYDTSVKFKSPSQSVLRGERVSVPSCSGRSLSSCQKALEKAGFSWYVSKVDSDADKGTLVGLSPSGSAPKRSAISILVSNGPKKGSEAWCNAGRMDKSECAKYLPPPTCGEGEVLQPTPAPGVCVPVTTQPTEPTQPGGQGDGGKRGR